MFIITGSLISLINGDFGGNTHCEWENLKIVTVCSELIIAVQSLDCFVSQHPEGQSEGHRALSGPVIMK